MPDYVALFRYRTGSGIVSFIHSGTVLTRCRTVRHSGSHKWAALLVSFFLFMFFVHEQITGSGIKYFKNRCSGHGSGRILTFLVGSGICLGPDPDPRLKMWHKSNLFGFKKCCVYQCWGSGSGQIRTFLLDLDPEILTGSGSLNRQYF
jgi:hypothetical protein